MAGWGRSLVLPGWPGHCSSEISKRCHLTGGILSALAIEAPLPPQFPPPPLSLFLAAAQRLHATILLVKASVGSSSAGESNGIVSSHKNVSAVHLRGRIPPKRQPAFKTVYSALTPDKHSQEIFSEEISSLTGIKHSRRLDLELM